MYLISDTVTSTYTFIRVESKHFSNLNVGTLHTRDPMKVLRMREERNELEKMYQDSPLG